MTVEVDQSGRVEDLSTGTVIAFANGESGVIFISAGAKRRLTVYLHQYSFIPAKDIPVIVFSVLLFILIADRKIYVLNIDEEYTGKNSLIEEILKKLFFRKGIKEALNIRFIRIGKQAAAHKVAWKAHRSKGRLRAVIKVSEKEVLRLLR